jgi:hypothetical protein
MMPVKRRKAPPLAEPTPAPTEISASPLLLNKEARNYLKCSADEIRLLKNRGILKPVPYLDGRIKPWRFLRSDLDKHITKQVEKAA